MNVDFSHQELCLIQLILTEKQSQIKRANMPCVRLDALLLKIQQVNVF